MVTAFRPLEPWMKKGAQVQLSNNTATIKNMLTANLGKSTGLAIDGPVVLSFLVQPTGTSFEWSIRPNNVEPVKSKVIPFPEHLG